MVTLLLLCLAAPASARSLDFFESYSIALYGGYENRNSFNAGLQAMTLDGPGDSSYFMGHLGLGFELGYAKLQGDPYLRILPIAEALFFIGYLQAGAGPTFGVGGDPAPGAAFMLGTGLRLFLGDEYQSPSISVGARFDWLVGDRELFAPTFVVRLAWPFDE